MGGIFYEHGLGPFLLVTVFLAGGAAWLTGRAFALGWGRPVVLLLSLALIGGAARFIHFALFSGTFASLHYYAADTALVALFGLIGFRQTRARQMATQYAFLYRRHGVFGWTKRRAFDAEKSAEGG